MEPVVENVPREFQALHDTLYKKITAMIGGETFDIRSDPTVVRILIQSAMTIVERARDANGNTYSGPEKKRIAVMVTKWVINDLATEGKIDPVTAKEICLNVDFFGGIAIDLAVAGAKNLLDVGQQMFADNGVARKKSCCGF